MTARWTNTWGTRLWHFMARPSAQPDHALRACKTAVDMSSTCKNCRWAGKRAPAAAEYRDRHSFRRYERGEYGLLGTLRLYHHGDNVNLASRLEGLNKQYGTNLIISQFTYQMCVQTGGEPLTVRELDTVRVKGKDEPVTIYELIGYGTCMPRKRLDQPIQRRVSRI